METALRALMGGSPLGGQQLIREARGRQLLTFDQANALAGFNAARERALDSAYQVSGADIEAARHGFEQFEGSLSMASSDERDLPPRGEAMSTKGLRLSPLGTPRPVPLPPEHQPWWILVVVFLVVIAGAVGAWMLFRARKDTSLDRGVAEWQAGRREIAIAEFERAVRDNPRNALAHVYLARLAREGGNGAQAREHATLAIQADPSSGAALREMGSTLLAARDFEMARRFYVRAIEVDPDDRASQGFLACALLMLGRMDESAKWMERAGQGAWSACAQPAPLGQPPRPR